MLSLAYVFVFEATKIFTYIAILYKMKRYMEGQLQILAKHKFAENIKRMTFAAAVNSFGLLIYLYSFQTKYIIVYTVETRVNEMRSVLIIFRVLSAINNVLTPWVMMATFKCV
ncbi:hypothetical protein PENTCL1PPCAC_4770, partial [Pristionchus entomophagus]